MSFNASLVKELCFAHFSSIVISGESVIGNHVNILINGVTIGTERGGQSWSSHC